MFVITLSGHVKCPLGLYGSPSKSLITAPGQTGTSIQHDPDSATNPASDFVGAVNFGTLSGGDGTPSQASFCLRARGNTKCHISASVSSYTATNLSYNGSTLSGSNGSELTFVTLGTGSVTASAHGNSNGHSYGTKFASGTDTLASLNSGSIGPVVDSSDKFASFTQAPSTAGDLASPDNYVENTVTFSVPTGFVWEPTNGASSGTFSISVQFEIFMCP